MPPEVVAAGIKSSNELCERFDLFSTLLGKRAVFADVSEVRSDGIGLLHDDSEAFADRPAVLNVKFIHHVEHVEGRDVLLTESANVHRHPLKVLFERVDEH